MSFEFARDMESSGVQFQLPTERVRVSVLEAQVCCCATDDLFQGPLTLSGVAEILGALTSRGDFLASALKSCTALQCK